MQGTEVENNLKDVAGEKAAYSAEESLGSMLVRISGVILFVVFIALAIISGIFDFDGFLDIISDVRITIPAVIGCYFLRFLLQFVALTFFAGLEKGQVRVGFSDRNLTPYVVPKRPFELKRFRIYLLLPFIVMSVVPFLMSVFIFSSGLYIIATISAAFCINDVISFFRSLCYPGYMMAADHPDKFGFVLYENPFHEI
jgi:hypothetical protein